MLAMVGQRRTRYEKEIVTLGRRLRSLYRGRVIRNVVPMSVERKKRDEEAKKKQI
jgi:hypothetical protein